MDENLIEKYKNEMRQMYNKRSKNYAFESGTDKTVYTDTKPDYSEKTESDTLYAESAEGKDKGKLIAIVTTIRSLYPVPNAKVTIFSGDYDNMNIMASAFTDESGRTDPFILDTPSKALSMDSQNQIKPYATYNMLVEADGYIPNIHLNIPVFSSVTSLQNSNLMLLETAGTDKGPRIFDESQKYNL